jgi:hypothetical protein
MIDTHKPAAGSPAAGFLLFGMLVRVVRVVRALGDGGSRSAALSFQKTDRAVYNSRWVISATDLP